MALTLMALADREGGHLDIEIANLEADVEEQLYIEVPDGCSRSRNPVRRLEEASYGLVHVGLLWSNKFGADLVNKEFDCLQVDMCVPEATTGKYGRRHRDLRLRLTAVERGEGGRAGSPAKSPIKPPHL